MHLHIIPRAVAKAAGLLYYFTGKPCRHGHISLRQTTGGGCVQCQKMRAARPDVRDEYNRKAREKYPETRAKRLGYFATYSRENRERFARWMAEWRARNPERSRSIKRASEAKRRAFTKIGDSASKVSDWAEQAQKVCHWCDKQCADRYEIDHYLPLSKGGLHVIANLVISCPFCNRSKKDRDPYDFAASLGRLF